MKRFLVRLAVWLLKDKTLDGTYKTEILNVLLEDIGALPFSRVITFDEEGTMHIKGKRITPEQARAVREGFVALQDSMAFKLLKEQMAYEAIEQGIHKNVVTEQLVFGKAALWLNEMEQKLIRHIAQ